MKTAGFITKNLLAMLVLFMLVQPLLADQRGNGQRQENRYPISLDHAVNSTRHEYKGRVISAETVRGDKGGTHNIRILTKDGRVRRIRVDSSTGEYLTPRRR